MVLTKERATILNEFLSADTGRAEKLAALAPGEAVIQINAYGHDFTEAELVEFGEAISVIAAGGGELNLDALDDVAGGSVTVVISVVAAAVSAISTIFSSRW